MTKTIRKGSGRVLFISHDIYQEDNHFPLGVGYLASVLRQNDMDVEVYCQDVYHYTNAELGNFLQRKEYEIIGVGFLAARFKETVLDLCDVINKYKKDAWLVLGGHGPSPIPEYMLETTKADVVAIGESEETICELVRCKVDNDDLSKVKGIAYNYDSEVFVNQRRKPIANLDSIPFPAWALFPMDKYTTCLKMFKMTRKDKALGILTSRGCVNRCNFCYRLEVGLRARSIENVIEEMKFLNNTYGINYFVINDELFVFSKDRVLAFENAAEETHLKIKYHCDIRVDVFDEEIAKSLKRSGCTFVNAGFESMDQNVLDIMRKNTTVEQNIEVAKIAKKVGLGLGLNFIWGNIGDTEESLRKSVEFIKKYNTYDQIRTIRPVTPYPGSELYYIAIDKGLLSGPDDFFRRFKNSDLLTVNFTDIPDEQFYEILFKVNKELIIDHFKHTKQSWVQARRLIDAFHKLYFEKETSFRGVRHYGR